MDISDYDFILKQSSYKTLNKENSQREFLKLFWKQVFFNRKMNILIEEEEPLFYNKEAISLQEDILVNAMLDNLIDENENLFGQISLTNNFKSK